MRTFLVLALALVIFAVPATAQTMTVKTTAPNGIAILKSDNTFVKDNFANNYTFTTYGRIYKYLRTTKYASISSYVYPPMTYGSTTYNRVSFSNYCYAQKGSTHKELGTTNSTTPTFGAQTYQVDIAGTGTYTLDLRAYGRIYDNATASLKLELGTTTLYSKTITTTYASDYKQIPITAPATLKVTVVGNCKPGAGSGYYDGYYAYMYFYLLKTGGASWTLDTKKTGCGPLTLGPANNPNVTKGTYFTVEVTGAQANKPVMALLGRSEDWFHFIKLPLDLGYMNAGCKLYVGFTYPYNRTADATGKATWRLYTSRYYSGTYYIQWAGLDAQSNLTMSGMGKLVY